MSRSGKEERQQPPLRQCSEHRNKAYKHTRGGKKKKPRELKWELEETNKSFYVCSLEHRFNWVAHVVRAINLSDLFSSSPVDDPVPLRQVAYEAGSHLPGSVGCGVWGSQIVFTGGVTPCSAYGLCTIDSDSVWSPNVYAFETRANTDTKKIRMLEANLKAAKYKPLTVELAGKLYTLSYERVIGDDDSPTFEVFDPELGRWEGLPHPPFFQPRSPYYGDGNFAYAIASTKIFASHENCPVFCFDVAHPNRDWRMVSTMCQGGPFPFINEALVLDLQQGNDDQKLMFAYHYQPYRLQVYLMSLSDNQETITKIGDLRIPELPDELGQPQRCQLLHIGGQKAFLVVTEIGRPDDAVKTCSELGSHKRHVAVIPFHFEVDMTKVDKDTKNCLTLQFMPLRSFEYHTNPSTFPDQETTGAFKYCPATDIKYNGLKIAILYRSFADTRRSCF
ncbi:uncharacterized protein LOC126796154 [Argentina anserina]|uniref:uncharacterized protein LOC126796154 n=1 Tax=Argentina anserina TaxID=57926 RepID=UPI0021761EB6|nr:uncharacterized protein LOC126796154 [Potentilla anserina]